MGLHMPRPRLTPQVRLLLRRMLPGLVGAGVTQLNLAVDVIIASLLPPGTVSLLYYADRVQQLPLGVIGTAVGTALLPLLSRQVRAGEARGVDRHTEPGDRVCPVPDPAGGGGADRVGVAGDVGAVRARRLRPGERAPVGPVARRLCAGAAGLRAGEGARAGFLRPRRHGTPVRIGRVAVVLNLALNVAFMVPLQHIGPALATQRRWCNVALLAWLLARRGHLVARREAAPAPAAHGLPPAAMAATLLDHRSGCCSARRSPAHGALALGGAGGTGRAGRRRLRLAGPVWRVRRCGTSSRGALCPAAHCATSEDGPWIGPL